MTALQWLRTRKVSHGECRRVASLVIAIFALHSAVGCQRAVDGNRRSVVLVVIDTLRADHLGLYGYHRPDSPSLDAFGKKAAVFEHAFSTAPWTLPSIASILTGQLALRHGAGQRLPAGSPSSFAQLQEAVPTLAEEMRAHGYATGAVVNNSFLHPSVGLNRGFDTYDYAPTNNTLRRKADGTVDDSLTWIDAQMGQPFFLFVHIFDAHMNYNPPKPFRGAFSAPYHTAARIALRDPSWIRERGANLSEDDRAFLEAAYDEEIAFIDQQIGRLLAGLRVRGLADSTLVVVTSDHGEEFFDHGGFEHGHTMYNELLHVPLLIAGPGVKPRRPAAPVSLVDIAPTIFDALDLPVPGGLAGTSLWPALRDGEDPAPRTITAGASLYGPRRRAVIRWPYKAVIDLTNDTSQLFNLATDPRETDDLATRAAPKLSALLIDLISAIAPPGGGVPHEQQPAEIDAATREQLRLVGYDLRPEPALKPQVQRAANLPAL